MCSSNVVDVKSVNSIYSGLMRDVRSLFESGFKILRLEDPGYLFIVGHYGDNSTWHSPLFPHRIL